MIQDLFSMILVEYYTEKCKNVLKFTFPCFPAHLKDNVSARKKNSEKYRQKYRKIPGIFR